MATVNASQHHPDGYLQAVKVVSQAAEPAATLVFVHGAFGTFDHFLQLTDFLSARYEIYLVNLPGHGRSAVAGAPSVANMARRLAGYLNARDTRDLILIGESIGANVLLGAVPELRRPVRGVLAVDPPVGPRAMEIVAAWFRRYATDESPAFWRVFAAAAFGYDVGQDRQTPLDYFGLFERLPASVPILTVTGDAADERAPIDPDKKPCCFGATDEAVLRAKLGAQFECRRLAGLDHNPFYSDPGRMLETIAAFAEAVLQGSAAPAVRPTPQKRRVIWFAGFPSSGTVKVQMMAAHLLAGPVQSLAHMDEIVRPMLVDPTMPPDPMGRAVEPIFTHHLPGPWLAATYDVAAIVQVVRHPVDIAFSTASYALPFYAPDYASLSLAAREAKGRELVREFLDLGTLALYANYAYGSWAVHARLWRDYAERTKVPYLRLRLEDVRRDEAASARQIAAILGIAASDAKIAGAVEAASLANSKRLEEEGLVAKTPSRFYIPALEPLYAAGWRYHGKGLSDYGKGHLTPGEWAQAKAVFGSEAQRLGYEFP